MMEYNPCFIIPCYNHGSTVAAVVSSLKPLGFPVVVVDDGSNNATKQALKALLPDDTVILLTLPENQGKGGAVIAGVTYAFEHGYTHGIQVDADGQHDLNSLPELIAKSQAAPDALISGKPIYDASVPNSRLYGRYVTHVWVWIETLSFAIKDSMCGFRAYPLKPMMAVVGKYKLGLRMDFDTEVMVRMYWDGCDIEFLDIKVLYPENGISHFDVLWDNIKISRMHTKLFFGMLSRIPKLIYRNLSAEKKWK